MTFEDLPDDFRGIPLPDLVVDDLLDLFVGPSERRLGAAVFLLCDERDRILQPVAIDEMPMEPGPGERESCIRAVAGAVAGGGSVLIAVARPGHPTPTEADLRWLTDAVDICEGRIRLLGVHLCTPAGTVRLDAMHV